MKNKQKRKMLDQKGQGVMEYIIISSLIGIVCITAVKKFGGTLDDKLDSMDKKIRKVKMSR